MENGKERKIIRQLPNALCLARIVLSIIGLALGLIQKDYIRWIFVAIFAVCIITDIADGKIARHFKVGSEFGGKFDGIADLFLTASVFIYAVFELKVLERGDVNLWTVLIIGGVLVFIKTVSAVITKIKFGKVNFLHTIAIKVCGGLLMTCAMIYIIFNKSFMWMLWIVSAVTALAFIEEMLIVIHDKVLNIDHKGFLFEKKKKTDASEPKSQDTGDGR